MPLEHAGISEARTANKETFMARLALNLEDPADLALLKTTGWRIAPGLVPGEPNQGLTAELRESSARLADYDGSWW